MKKMWMTVVLSFSLIVTVSAFPGNETSSGSQSPKYITQVADPGH